MPTLDSAPGTYQDVGPRVQDWSNRLENPAYTPEYALYAEDGPDAQGNITHRAWDPFDPAQPTGRIQLCNSNYYHSVEELFDSMEGEPFNASMVRTYVRRFRVKVKHPTMGPNMVCACPGIPMPYSPYCPGRKFEWDMYARAVRISAKREASSQNEYSSWIVEVNYSTQMPDGGPIPPSKVQLGFAGVGAQNNPWEEPPALEWDPETTTTTPLADKDGKPFLNSAGQPMYPAPAVEEGVAVLSIKRNWRFNTLFQVRQHIERYSHVVNTDSFVGATRGQVLSLPPKAVEMYRGPLRFWQMTYRLKFKKGPTGWLGWLENLFVGETWQPKMLDAGMYEIRNIWGIPDPNKKLIPIFRGGVQVSQPVPLKDGRVAAPGQETFLRFRYYPETSFSELLPVGKL